MLYYGERKKGCRFIEVIFHGYKTLILENDYIRTMLLVDKGVDIISLAHKKSDTDFVWTNPMGLSCLEKRRKSIMDDYNTSDNYVGGMFEILPNFGDECDFYGKVHFPQHSEVASLPWDYQVLEDCADCVKLRFVVKLSKFPFMLTKVLTIKNDSMSLFFEEELKNLGNVELPYLWAQHPCVGAPFLNENCVLELPWNEQIKMPKQNYGEQIFSLHKTDKNYALIKNTKTNLGIGFEFDAATYTHCGVWISPFSDCGHHRHEGAYVASILPTNCGEMGLVNAYEKGAAPILKPNETKKSWYTISLFENAD